jgi:hypothetical protein
MKKFTTSLGLFAGGMLLSGAVSAAEPNPEVSRVLARIKTRQAAKAEAAARDEAAKRARRGREGGRRRYEGRQVHGQ